MRYFAEKNQSAARVTTIEEETLADVVPCRVEQRGVENRLAVLIEINDDFSVKVEGTSAVATSKGELCEQLQLSVIIEDT